MAAEAPILNAPVLPVAPSEVLTGPALVTISDEFAAEALNFGWSVDNIMVPNDSYLGTSRLGVGVVDFGNLQPDKFDSHTVIAYNTEKFGNLRLVASNQQLGAREVKLHTIHDSETDSPLVIVWEVKGRFSR